MDAEVCQWRYRAGTVGTSLKGHGSGFLCLEKTRRSCESDEVQKDTEALTAIRRTRKALITYFDENKANISLTRTLTIIH